ncbi:MAG TPA: hypothetical protein VHY84_28280 [Bryobacteraceae bacterium]|jgi:hypothetical protein|nr:hypothetical protein [Bryobacteraceae bacterium]
MSVILRLDGENSYAAVVDFFDFEQGEDARMLAAGGEVLDRRSTILQSRDRE